jgi:choline dehydrogenase-like flavoprotein
MIKDMTVRGFKEDTRRDYVRHVRAFAAFIGRSPDTATAEDLRLFQLHQTRIGMQPPSYFCKSEGLAASDEIVIDAGAHNTTGPLGVSVRNPILPAARQFVEAAIAAGIPKGDYNGRNRGGPNGVVSLTQYTMRDGRRSSTYQAFLAGETEQRPNLTIITGARATRVLLDVTNCQTIATGVEYRSADGESARVHAAKEVILSAGAIGSPHLLLLSGIGPRQELEAIGAYCAVDAPHVGKHLQDHLMCPVIYPAPGIGVPMNDVVQAMGPDALRAPAGPLPADPAGDASLSPELLADRWRPPPLDNPVEA